MLAQQVSAARSDEAVFELSMQPKQLRLLLLLMVEHTHSDRLHHLIQIYLQLRVVNGTYQIVSWQDQFEWHSDHAF